MLGFYRKTILIFILITAYSLCGSKIFSQTIKAEQNYAMNSPGIVTVQTILSATVYVNKVEIKQRTFDKLVDSIRKLDVTGSVLSPEQKLDILVQALYSKPLRFFSGTGKYLMQEHRITSTGTGFFVTSHGYIITNCHVIERDSAFIRQRFILSTFKEVTDANIRSLESSWGMMLTDEQKNLLYNTYGFVYTQVSSLILFDLKKEINVLYRIDGENGEQEEQIKKAILVQKGSPMPGKDLALLKISDENNLPMLTMSKDSTVDIGEQVLVYGFPEPVTSNIYLSTEASMEPTLTSGIVSAIKKSIGGWPVIQMDAAIAHGSSGSPVCDAKGQVIGMASFGSLEQRTGDLVTGFNFAIPVSVINEFLDSAHIHQQPGEACVSYNKAIGFFYEEKYSQALKNFEKAKAFNKNYPGLFYYMRLCKNKIAAKENLPFWRKKYYLLIAIFVLLLAGGYFFYFRKRRGNYSSSK